MYHLQKTLTVGNGGPKTVTGGNGIVTQTERNQKFYCILTLFLGQKSFPNNLNTSHFLSTRQGISIDV